MFCPIKRKSILIGKRKFDVHCLSLTVWIMYWDSFSEFWVKVLKMCTILVIIWDNRLGLGNELQNGVLLAVTYDCILVLVQKMISNNTKTSISLYFYIKIQSSFPPVKQNMKTWSNQLQHIISWHPPII